MAIFQSQMIFTQRTNLIGRMDSIVLLFLLFLVANLYKSIHFQRKRIDKSANKLSDFSDLKITTKIMLLQSRASVNIFPFFDMNDQRIRVMNYIFNLLVIYEFLYYRNHSSTQVQLALDFISKHD